MEFDRFESSPDSAVPISRIKPFTVYKAFNVGYYSNSNKGLSFPFVLLCTDSQPIIVISLTDGFRRQFYPLRRPKSCWQWLTSASIVGRIVTIRVTDAQQWPKWLIVSQLCQGPCMSRLYCHCHFRVVWFTLNDALLFSSSQLVNIA